MTMTRACVQTSDGVPYIIANSTRHETVLQQVLSSYIGNRDRASCPKVLTLEQRLTGWMAGYVSGRDVWCDEVRISLGSPKTRILFMKHNNNK